MQVFEKNILGCFVMANMNDERGEIFRTYVWGEGKIAEMLKPLKYEKYGTDLTVILFQFYVNPIPYLQNNLKEVENYRKDERSIAVSIIVNEENFFSKPDLGRKKFIHESIFKGLDSVIEVVQKKKLDTNVSLLKSDVEEILHC
jgi:hypothetical protein